MDNKCNEEKCSETNIGLINGDWLCLDCGEKVKTPNEELLDKPQANQQKGTNERQPTKRQRVYEHR